MQYRKTQRHEQGIVSIITVLMFSMLIAIMLTGFSRIMLQEQQDTLQDDLSKSAYNSAQAGVEDAKRAVQYCAENPGKVDPVLSIDCNNLYQPNCPGFNTPTANAAQGAFFGIGIKPPAPSGSDVGDAQVNQRYTCVIISPSSDIRVTLGGPNTTTNSTTYKIAGSNGAGYSTIELSWHGLADGAGDPADTILPSTIPASPNLANLRQPDWNYPALLRTTLISANAALSTVNAQPIFLYPSSSASAVTGISFAPATQWSHVRCVATATPYACTLSITPPVGTPAERFIVLQPFYKGTDVRIRLLTGAGAVVPMDGQTTIDATGAANDVFRRVQTRVAPGKPIATGTSLDVGGAICKNFFVSADTFDNLECN